MAKVVYSPRALAHIERAFEFLASEDPRSASRAVRAIRGAVTTLADNPLIGRAAEQGLRELVISFGKTGYVALYWHAPELDEVQVLAIRHQREVDYPF